MGHWALGIGYWEEREVWEEREELILFPSTLPTPPTLPHLPLPPFSFVQPKPATSSPLLPTPQHLLEILHKR